MIVPPEKVQETIRKTAGYVSRNGPQFSSRLLKESGDKFSFLASEDPFHDYYVYSLEQYKAGEAVNEPSTAEKTASSQIQKQQVEPEKQYFFQEIPEINEYDLQTIKLAAKHYAVNHNERYLAKMAKVSLYEFLSHSHRLNGIFQKYVELYRLVVKPNEAMIKKIDQVKDGANEKENLVRDFNLTRKLLEAGFVRAESHARESENKKKQEDKIKQEKIAYASVNWDEFKIVQTIELTDIDRYSELALPLNKNDLIYRSLQQKKASSLIEEAPPDFDDNEILRKEKIFERPVAVPSSKKGMKIRSAGETRLKGNNSTSAKTGGQVKYVKSPITGEMIPEDKFDLHMKIVLRDKNYEQEKQNYLEKVTDSNITDSEVIENIKRLRGQGGDSQDSKRVKLQWDGYKNSTKAIQEKADKQMSAKELEDIKKRRYQAENKIGPRF